MLGQTLGPTTMVLLSAMGVVITSAASLPHGVDASKLWTR